MGLREKQILCDMVYYSILRPVSNIEEIFRYHRKAKAITNYILEAIGEKY